MVKRIYFSLFITTITASLLMITPNAIALTKIEASVEKNPVIDGEYFVLNVSADDDLNAGALDTSILLNDFIVGRTSVSRSTQMLNFNTSKETRWQVLLSPKHTGKVTIPSFTVDGISSNPIILDVAPKGTQVSESPNIFMEATTNIKEAYVGQLISYKVKLYLAVELQRGVLNAPVIEGANIKQIGEDKDGSEIVNGRRFRVIERTYGIVADLPGEIIINGASFSGDVLIETQRRGGMFSFNESIPMQTEADRLVLKVLNNPASYKGDWLVSDMVTLRETWPEEQTEFEAGSPITRTISLIALNVDENSLPTLAMPKVEGIKIYPEKPLRQTGVRDDQIIAQYSLTAAIVPTRPGTYTLPEIKVPWWNAQRRKQEFAILPAKTIKVVAGEMSQTDLPLQVGTATTTTDTSTHGYWPWLTALFACLWLLTLILWLNARKQRGQNTPVNARGVDKSSDGKPSSLNTLQGIKTACETENVAVVIAALRTHFSQVLVKQVTLADISALTPALATQINKLQAAKYSQNQGRLDTQALLDAVNAFELEQKQQQPAKSLIVGINP